MDYKCNKFQKTTEVSTVTVFLQLMTCYSKILKVTWKNRKRSKIISRTTLYGSWRDNAKKVETVWVHLKNEDQRLVNMVTLGMVQGDWPCGNWQEYGPMTL